MKIIPRLPIFVVSLLLVIHHQPVFAQLSQEVVFTDSFDSEFILDNPNEEFADRQTGSLAPSDYAVRDPNGFQIELGSDIAPDGLLFMADNNWVSVSPNINFNQGGNFTIEFDVNPGINDESSESNDWCAFVFGSSSQNVFVNGSNGMGILFRNNGDIQVFDKGAAIYGGNGGFEGGLPTDDFFTVRIEVEARGFNGSPAKVSMFINDEQARIAEGDNLHFDRADGFTSNFITLEGAAFGGNFWEHGFDNLSVSMEPCISVSPTLVNTRIGDDASSFSLALPQSLIDSGDSQITITSSHPGIVTFEGADDTGVLVIDVDAQSDLNHSFSLSPVGAGRASISFSSSSGACVSGSLAVNVASGSGFEEITFFDNFDSSATDEWDINADLDDRQSGTLGSILYLESDNTSTGGPGDDLTQVNSDLYPGKLFIIGQSNGVSPDHNFTEGTSFSVEVKVTPGANFEDQTHVDWAALIIGATQPNRFVNAHDGFGVLFRNDGRIEVWDGANRIHGSSFDDAFPPGEILVRLEASTFSFAGDPVELNLFINDEAVPLTSNGNTYVKSSGFFGNYITLSGIGGDLDYTFDDLKVTAEACVNFLDADLSLRQGEESSIRVKVPEQLIESESATVTVVSSNPAIAAPEGATDGRLELTFSSGGPLIQEIPLEITGKGSGTFSLIGPDGVCVGPDVNFSIISALVQNPSFEQDPRPDGVGYGAVSHWPGFSGINNDSGPFADNGLMPDRNQIAFAQGSRTITQTLNGFIVGDKYRLQFFYNVRNCCGGTMGFTVSVDGVELETIGQVDAVGGGKPYHFRSWEFEAENESVELEIRSEASGDATLLVDAITVIPSGDDYVTIANSSFEASGNPPWPGYINPASIAGWTGTGGYGVNFTGAGPFADNGSNSDQDYVAFMQGAASLSQTLSGLLNGQNYNLSVDVNARSGNAPVLRISAGENVLFEEAISPVGGAEPFRKVETSFVANSSSVELKFEQIAAGDNTVLIDNVILIGESVKIPPVNVSVEALELSSGSSEGSFVIRIPELLTLNNSAEIRVISQNPDIAIPVGAENGVLTLTFDESGDLEQTVEVETKGRGLTSFTLEGPDGVTFNPSTISLRVVSSLVRNPSFESNYNSSFPSYGPIDSWVDGDTGNQGVNEANGPFHDNGIIPDRGRVAFIQVSQTLHQDISGLTPDQDYTLEFYYNARSWGSDNIIDLTINFDDVEIDTILDVNPVGADQPYNYARYTVTPTSESARLEFSTFAQGDATVLLDAVTLTPVQDGDILLANPSFEASGIVATFPGYIQPAPLAGWSAAGSYGLNGSGEGPFANNGTNPDQDLVLFLQGAGSSIAQVVEGLTSGTSYIIEVAANARNGNSPTLSVSVDGSEVLSRSISPVGGIEPYTKVITGFTADSDTATIQFAQTAEGDNTVLLDLVRVYEGVPPKGAPSLGISGDSNSITMAWDADATGYVLQSAPSIGGPWSNVTAPAVLNGDQLNVSVTPDQQSQFFRLAQE